jgi:LysR family glycine cleavage system transcriptional activator
VRAFEAAARYRNLVRAADELCVTSTAVSHQVRLLEDFLQIKLFDRRSGRLELTAAGRACLADLTDALDRIDNALSNVRATVNRQRLTVAASTSVTSLWLLPRIQRFVTAAPDIDVVFNAISSTAALEAKHIDVAISNWAYSNDKHGELLMEEEIIPVCAPSLLSAGLSKDDALRILPLLHDDKRAPRINGAFPTWEMYFGEGGFARSETAKGLRFNQSGLAIEAAVEGYGLLLGRSRLIEPFLQDGRLMQVGPAYHTLYPYYVVSSKHVSSAACDTFRDWLHGEVEAGVPAVVGAERIGSRLAEALNAH